MMNIYETLNIEEDKDNSKKLADLAVGEIKEKLKDQILFLRDNSKDLSIRHHLKEINKDNKDDFLQNLSNKDVIDFNEVILKGDWKTYLDGKNEEKLTKYKKEEVADQNLTTLDKDRERLIPADNFRLSFRAMIDHYAKNLEIEEYEKKKETERQLMKDEFMKKLGDLEKDKPHIVAEIKNIDPDIFRRPDYKVALNLNKDRLGDYEGGLKKYFDLKTSSMVEERSSKKKVEIIMADPRFKYYCALRELLDLAGPCNPEIFLSN